MIKLYVKGLVEVEEAVKKIKDWADSGYQITLTNAVDGLASRVRDDIRHGMETDTTPMAPLKESTLKGPVRRDGNPTPREFYGDTPLNATGALANDIVGQKINKNEYEVGAYSDEGNMKLSSNAKTNHSGSPFAGDTPKPTRDPLQVTEKRLDYIEEAIVADIEKALGI